MKKIISCMIILSVIMGCMMFPTFSESNDNIIYFQDFEKFNATNDIFSSEHGSKPDGMSEFVGDGTKSGAIISEGKIGGSKSLRLMRSDMGTANIRIQNLSTRQYEKGTKIAFSFSFRYETLGVYGITAILSGTSESTNLDDYGGETRNLFAAKTVNGKDSIYVATPGSAERTLVTDALKPSTDISIKAVFTLGSEEYEFFINGESKGTFKYIGVFTALTGIRFDCHDTFATDTEFYASFGEGHVCEIYFDDIKVAVEGEPIMKNIDTDNKEYVFKADDYLFYEGFEDLGSTEDYITSKDDAELFSEVDGLTYLRTPYSPFVASDSKVKLTTNKEEVLSEDASLMIKDRLDARWWNLSIPVEEPTLISLKVKITNLTSNANFYISEADDEERITNSENEGGLVWKIIPSTKTEGKYDIVNNWNQYITTIEPNVTNKISVLFTGASDTYLIFVNGVSIPGSTSTFPLDLNNIMSFRCDFRGVGTLITIDDLEVETGTVKENVEETATPEVTATPEATETPTPTAEPTEKPTEAPTQAPEKKSGCGSVITSTLSIIALSSIAIIAIRKKQ